MNTSVIGAFGIRNISDISGDEDARDEDTLWRSNCESFSNSDRRIRINQKQASMGIKNKQSEQVLFIPSDLETSLQSSQFSTELTTLYRPRTPGTLLDPGAKSRK